MAVYPIPEQALAQHIAVLAKTRSGLTRSPVALSVRQPWPHRMFYEGKDIENRDWPTRFRGPVLIHAGKAPDGDVTPDMARGGIVGLAEIIDCVTASSSRWFVGDYGFVLRNATPLEFIPCKGALGFFKPDLGGHMLRARSAGTKE